MTDSSSREGRRPAMSGSKKKKKKTSATHLYSFFYICPDHDMSRDCPDASQKRQKIETGQAYQSQVQADGKQRRSGSGYFTSCCYTLLCQSWNIYEVALSLLKYAWRSGPGRNNSLRQVHPWASTADTSKKKEKCTIRFRESQYRSVMEWRGSAWSENVTLLS